MKILYITKGDHVDYQDDCLFIGLRELLGSSVVDYNKRKHNYLSYDEKEVRNLYGRGMTVSRVLEDIDVDRDDITSKIKSNFFDYIVYGSIWRCSDYIEKILKYYPPHKIIAVDGEDETNIHSTSKLGIRYFKRELAFDIANVNPISFAFPTTKINHSNSKITDFSYITPLNRQTYIYDNEQDYYNDYSKSRFGVTLKKAGWDCMRHYEILGNDCIPFFINIENCPKNTMVSFPKLLCSEINNLIGKMSNKDIYDKYYIKFQNHFLSNNTTSALAKYFLETLNK
jgi:hypothetical protein